jgi:HTH-type transcriptional regulator, glycine betaine synthesis regulator
VKGYLWTEGHASTPSSPVGQLPHLSRWEAIAVDAVGNVIEFWGFKRNQGRVWALLYLRGEPLAASIIERDLALSKGAVSMLVRDLERWGVIIRVRAPGSTAWQYRAETDLIKMVSRVVEEREAAFLERIQADLAEARRLAGQDPSLPRERLSRLERMNALADQTQRALRLFIKTARLDVGAMFGVFREARGARKHDDA